METPKFNRQKIGSKIPSALDIRDCATKNYVDTNTLSLIPTELLPTGIQILEMSRKLNKLMDNYEKMRSKVRQQSVEHLREEWNNTIAENRKRKVEVESKRIRQHKVSQLKGTDKSFFKRNGMTREEFRAELIREFKKEFAKE